ADGSLFRLPHLAKDKTRVALPPLPGARLTVALEGEDGFYLEPRLVFESARFLDPREEALVPLQELARRRGEGRTILELARPRGLVPDVLRLGTAPPAFDRTVEVWDVRPGGNDVLLGRASLFRLEAIAAVGESEMTLGPARGERLRVDIVDGDSAPLDGLAFAAVVRQPSLVFSLATGGDEEPAAMLYFGGGRPSSEGLSLLRLRAEDVAHARPDLADVRVVDAAARQWPYVLEPDAAREWQPLEIASPLRRERASRYRLGLPVALVRLDQIVLDTDTPFFDRAFRLTA